MSIKSVGEMAGKSVPEELVLNAEDYLTMMRVASSRRLYSMVAHMGQLALELSIKADYAKRFGGRHPWTHELGEIMNFEFSSRHRSLYDEITSSPAIHKHYFAVKTAWRMQDRYLRRSVDKTEAILYKTGFREVTKWIIKNFA